MGWKRNTWAIGLGVLLAACGGEAKRSAGGTGGTGGSGGGPSSDGTGGDPNSSTVDGPLPWATGGTGGVGGTGGAPQMCSGVAGRPVEGCVEYYEGSAGEGGLGGRGPSPEFDECADDEWFEACEQKLSGEVTAVERTDDWCGDSNLSSWSPDSVGERTRIQLWNDDTPVGYHVVVVVGPVQMPLDVSVGDKLDVSLQQGRYGAGLMFGSRIVLMRQNELVAVVNDSYPVDSPISFGELEFERGDRLCREADRWEICEFSEHALEVSYEDDTQVLSPGSDAQLGPFELVVGQNYAVEASAGCEDGDVTTYGAFRFNRFRVK